MTGTVSAISAPDFTLIQTLGVACSPLPGVACPTILTTVQTPVETTSQTTYQGFTTDDFSGLAVNDLVSVRGWLIEQDNGLLDPAISLPYVVAQDITLH